MHLARSLIAVVLVWCGFAVPVAVRAERLPIKTFTTADGLAHNVVHAVVRDSRGFLWFATDDGLSRFDGYGFRNYSVEEGLPHRTVMDLLETRSGEFWVATWDGLVHFNPAGTPSAQVVSANDSANALHPPMFAVIRPDDSDSRTRGVTSLVEARDGSVWCGTRKGVYRVERSDGRWHLRRIDFRMRTDTPLSQFVHDILEDPSGSIWVAGSSGLYRRSVDGDSQLNRTKVLDQEFLDVFADPKGAVWAASKYGGLFRLSSDAGRDIRVLEHYDPAQGWPTSWIFDVRATAGAKAWLATNSGLVEWSPDASSREQRFRAYGRRHGLTAYAPTTLGEDAAGNLWIGTEGMGAMRLARQGFTTYDETDEVVGVMDVFADPHGKLYVYAAKRVHRAVESTEYLFARVADRLLEWFKPPHPFFFGCCASNVVWSEGEWWISGDRGVYRVSGSADFASIPAGRVVRLYEIGDTAVTRFLKDSRGDIWMAMRGPNYGDLKLWDHSSRVLRDMAHSPGLPSLTHQLPQAFGEDALAAVWIGLDTGAARYKDGKFAFFTADHGLPPGRIQAIHTDDSGRLWLGSSQGGLIRGDDFASDRPRFEAYTMDKGLSGNSIEAIGSDAYGRIYAATGRGIDRYDPLTGSIEYFTADEGVVQSSVRAAYRDRVGSLWFATGAGLSLFTPGPRSASSAPAIVVTGLTIGGIPQPVSAVGETNIVVRPDIGQSGKRLEIDFVALGSRSKAELRYQYLLEGAGRDWGPTTSRRTVNFENLAPGQYRFVVRALTADGVSSTTPATVAFTVLPPFWRQWWFMALLAFAAIVAAVSLHRYRLSRALELERVRTRIAMDLHDDIGANLTRIAILSEVARRSRANAGAGQDAPLSSIGTIAREAATSMSDIVWAINPEHDTLKEVSRRMRHHAEEVFEGGDVQLTLDVPDDAESMPVGIDVRRDFYLIFKEAVNNCARHSRCRRVAIALRVADARLSLEVTDDGVGFDTSEDRSGNGLASMRRRAGRLAATLDVISTAGLGTTVRLTMRLSGAQASAMGSPEGEA